MALLLQTQIQIFNPPLSGLVSGFDNNQLTSQSLVVGSSNKVLTPFTLVSGVGNNLTGVSGSGAVLGDYNQVEGKSYLLSGLSNFLLGTNITVEGNGNESIGTNITVEGNNNQISNEIQQVNDVRVRGNDNIIQSTASFIDGFNNQILQSSYIYVSGDQNIVYGGLIKPDLSSFTESNPTFSIDPVPTTTSNIKIFGNTNIIGTNSTFITIFGNENEIVGSVSNTFVIGNQTSVTQSNQIIISQDKDVQIDSNVLPCKLIQDYTPSQQDQTGQSGWVTKDDENIYVKTTNFGWRQIPFNNSYGSFYDTTIQTNLTASTPNKMTFNSTQIQNTVTVLNGGDVYVDYSGLYNIQFSAQLDKTDSGSDDVDIWLRYNGVDVPWSNTRITLAGNNAKVVAAWNFVQPMTASSYFNLMWSSADVDLRIYAEGTQSQPTRPGIPSIILTVDKISSL